MVEKIYKAYVLQIYGAKESQRTKESIEKHNPKFSVEIITERPFGLKGVNGIVGVPFYKNSLESSCLIVTDKVLCKGDLSHFIKHIAKFTLNTGADGNITWYRPDGAGPINPFEAFSQPNLGVYASNGAMAKNTFLGTNTDYRALFKFQKSPYPDGSEEDTVIFAEDFPKPVTEDHEKEAPKENKKKKWWFR